MPNTENNEKELNKDVDSWKDYSFGQFDNPWQNMVGSINGFMNMFLFDTDLLNARGTEVYKDQWIQYGNNFITTAKSYWDPNSSLFDFSSDTNLLENFATFGKDLGTSLKLGLKYTGIAVQGALQGTLLAAAQGANWLASKNVITGAIEGAENFVGNIFKGSVGFSEKIGNTIDDIAGIFQTAGDDTSHIMNILGKGLEIFSSGGLRQYVNGIDETSFGRMMEASWNKDSNNSFIKLINNTSGTAIKINKTTPFDAGANMNNIYGHMLLGAPPLFNHLTDPKNRSIANTFLRDAKFLTLTPGFPKYNGSSYLLKQKDDAYHQTTDPESMIAYLLKNGIDSNFATKDKRYYTFKSDFDEYYSYLETMLNTAWLKMGLGTMSQKSYNIFSFFNIDEEPQSSNPVLKEQYRSSIGFFVNPTGSLTENLSTQPTAYSLASDVNMASEEYQKINFLTGMGTGGAVRNASAMMVKSAGLANQLVNFAKSSAANVINVLTEKTKSISDLVIKGLKLIPAGINDTRNFLTNQDSGAVMQSFATTNGMKVVYPELWSDTTYSRSMNINFSFTSPYGDPLSIFNYVIAPFCALLCFAMPRQAADNGYVSPFFVRADIPGLFTSDLALIQDFTWSKGGDNNLWTKDGLPRSISGSMTLVDLYPYLAMTKRISFLSSNPNYTVFLDNLASLHAVESNNTDDNLNEYYKTLLNRVTGDQALTGLWNNYSDNNIMHHVSYANKSVSRSRLGGNTKNHTSSSWFRGLE